jgi:hypothetical protein
MSVSGHSTAAQLSKAVDAGRMDFPEEPAIKKTGMFIIVLLTSMLIVGIGYLLISIKNKRKVARVTSYRRQKIGRMK